MRIIDAESLENKLVGLMERYAAQGRMAVAEDYNFLITVLTAAPTLTLDDIVPHGRWETSLCDDYYGDMMYKHSHKECGYDCRNYLEDGDNYCPNCGAKMDLEEV